MLGAAEAVLAVEMGRAAAKNQPYAEEEVTQLLLDTAKAACRIAWLDAGVRYYKVSPVFASILLFVAVIHVVVISYRHSSYSHHRVSTGWASLSWRMPARQHTHVKRRPHGVWISGASFAARARAEVSVGCPIAT